MTAADGLGLCAAYIERHPEAAGRALGDVAIADAAALLAVLKPGVSARVLAQAGAMRAARLILAMDGEAAAAILAQLPDTSAAAILRLLEAPHRDGLLECLPDLARRHVSDSLEYPADAVGSIMTRVIVALVGTTRAADALDALRENGPAEPGCVFVTDRRHGVIGIVSAMQLLCSSSRARLSELIDTAPPLVASRTSIAAVVDHDAWLTYSVLPVVNRDRQLIGALSYSTLRRHLKQPTPASQPGSTSILLSMSEDMVDSVSGLWGLMLDAPPGRARGSRQ